LRHKLTFLFPLILLSLSVSVHAQLWSGVISPNRAVDWSNVGVVGGIPARTTQCAVLGTAGESASYQQNVSAAQINAAIASCPSGQTVFLNAGTYNLKCSSTCIEFKGVSNVTLRGAGADQTLIVMTGGGDTCTGQPSTIVCIQSTDTSYVGAPSNTANWTAGSYSPGTTTLTFSNASNLQPGITPVILDQLDDLNDTGNLYVGCEFGPISGANTNCYSGAGPGGASRGEGAYNTIRGQEQIVTVTACSPSCPNSGTTKVTISPGLYAPNWNSAKTPQAWWASGPVTADGVEDLSLDNTGSSAQSDVTIFNCYNCWVKAVRGMMPGRSHVWIWTSNHITVQDSYFWGSQGHSSDSYGLEAFGASDVLFQNNVIQNTTEPLIYNGDCEGCVAGYNYTINDNYSTSGWLNQAIGLHANTLFVLAEGNVAASVYTDNFHGNHAFFTAFRNRFDGYESNNGTWPYSNTIPIRSNPFSRYFNIVGNILGSNGLPQVVYTCSGTACTNYASNYWLGAYPEGGETPDAMVQSTSFRWGNYDLKTAAVRWCGSSSNTGWSTTCSSTSEVPTSLSIYANPIPTTASQGQALPASFYLSSQPSWWPSGKAWPATGPDVTGGNILRCSSGPYSGAQVTSGSQCSGGSSVNETGGMATSNPAMDCYFAMGGPPDGTGSALTFNASSCYSTVLAPAPPTDLTVTVD
jgi:hypothetical protein